MRIGDDGQFVAIPLSPPRDQPIRHTPISASVPLELEARMAWWPRHDVIARL
jgi:hypothetical protein